MVMSLDSLLSLLLIANLSIAFTTFGFGIHIFLWNKNPVRSWNNLKGI